jgi:predicted MFS family arabinose efflux permease
MSTNVIPTPVTQAPQAVAPWRATLSATFAILVGIGLSRFGYTPLVPALITQGWFTPSATGYLGAANLMGYLIGALVTRRIATLLPTVPVLRGTMALAAACFFACAFPLSFEWYFAWRFVSGFSGAVLMVLAAPAVMPHIPPSRRGLAGGAIFTGVGLGIIISGTIVPFLLRLGLAATWHGLGILALFLVAGAWGGWPRASETLTPAPTQKPARGAGTRLPIIALYIEYALNAVGLVPAMVFLVDFVARGLGKGIDIGASYWVLFGLGAAGGPMLLGRLADTIGFGLAVRLALLVQAAVTGLLALTTNLYVVALASVILGACGPGVTTLVLGRIRELIPRDVAAQRSAWSGTTMAFSLGQAGAAYGFSYLFAQGGDYGLLFELAAAGLVLALIIDVAAGLGGRPDRE